MPTVVLTGDLRRYTGLGEQGQIEEVQVQALNYRAVRRELQAMFPLLEDAVLDKYGVAIDGVMVQTPLLETLEPDSELVFIAKIAAG
ncbi:hypothetical protein EYC98_09090 [Halieaceae bacterium IMCC14734]|uniref:MoaD/ThiS family protein n=1 Tax=Candidatus Litorirhabdus singularis TaxID=2518993 RepID=A0ABT3TI08_9GAMM|nr:hypothetical protein [Candidatus Litorirhabdus singularis]MCX2981017.1 hypothetical protein [Candidatus Litorirhabdus singularis]